MFAHARRIFLRLFPTLMRHIGAEFLIQRGADPSNYKSIVRIARFIDPRLDPLLHFQLSPCVREPVAAASEECFTSLLPTLSIRSTSTGGDSSLLSNLTYLIEIMNERVHWIPEQTYFNGRHRPHSF